MSKPLKPMLAVQAPAELVFPLYASPKIDGVRALIQDAVVVSRKLLAIPNEYVQTMLGHHEMSGLDGELTVGPPNAPNCMQETMSGVMSRDGKPDFTFWVFDFWTQPSMPFSERYQIMQRADRDGVFEGQTKVQLLSQMLVSNMTELNAYESLMLAQGYEGVMVRKPSGIYKYGRSTAKEGHLLKVKRFVDSEAVVIGFEERMHNGNVATRDEVGGVKRSSAQAGLVPMGTLGALKVRDLATGIEFDVGTGFDDHTRAVIWAQPGKYHGQTITYKHFANAGVVEKPRFPVFKSFRDARDIS